MKNDRLRLADTVWRNKYRFAAADGRAEATIGETWARVARAIASVEAPAQQAHWEQRFLSLLQAYRFLPGGRILAGAGTQHDVTLLNCFVMDRIEDSMDGIFAVLGESARTLQQGGGIGLDFSTLRPAGVRAARSGGVASGPVSFMHIWDAMCRTLLATSSRRGAMMATLRCDHPDIEEFIQAKRDPTALRRFNLSVLITDAFMAAVKEGESWPLVFPDPERRLQAQAYVQRSWPGYGSDIACAVLRTVNARALWEALMRATYDVAEPGVLFVDRINQENNLAYREQISATNPCGEIPLPPNGSCDLGSFNLVQFVLAPFEAGARFDLDALAEAIPVAVRFLDNVIDSSRFPLEKQAQAARASRRVGLGVTGWADALIMLNVAYDSPQARSLAQQIGRLLRDEAYRASVALAAEKGPFPALDKAYLERPFVRRLPADLRAAIGRQGIRNSHLLAIAPTGSISLLAGNVSSGIEPVFEAVMRRSVLDTGERHPGEWVIADAAIDAWRTQTGDAAGLPGAYQSAYDVAPADHVAMQAAWQPYIDNAISKTINVPVELDFDQFRSIYEQAFDAGLKGCTTYRPNVTTGSILSGEHQAIHCCAVV